MFIFSYIGTGNVALSDIQWKNIEVIYRIILWDDIDDDERKFVYDDEGLFASAC